MQYNRCRGGVQVSIQRKKTVEILLDGFDKENHGKEKKKRKFENKKKFARIKRI